MTTVRNIVILTGAGISAESGVPTFRGADGLWEGHRVEDVATPQAFRRDPVLVQRFYDARRAALARVEPNPAHLALARLDRHWPGELLIVTQNVDDLHDRAAGSDHGRPPRLVHMHGELQSALCGRCGTSGEWTGDLTGADPCSCGGTLRPDIVWFGEMPYHMDRIDAAIAACDLFVSIGTSGAVYPAAGFVDAARHAGARTLELNLEPSAGTRLFDEARHGPAGRLVPEWVDAVLGG
ncbi:MAG: NAD-dependent deacylase [Janthinobacterium lividum]